MTVTKEPDHRGEHEVSRKTISRGMPGVSGVTVVTNARAYYHHTRGCGRTRRPAFPAPSKERAGSFQHNSGELRRENAKVCFICERAGFLTLPWRARVDANAMSGGVG